MEQVEEDTDVRKCKALGQGQSGWVQRREGSLVAQFADARGGLVGEALAGKDEGEPATAVVAPAVVAPLVGAIFFRRAVRRPVIECTKRETVARSSSDSAAEAEEPACIVSSSKA